MNEAQSAHALTKLTRLAQRKPENEYRLTKALEGNLADLASAAISVAQETGDPIGTVLARLLEHLAEVPPNVIDLADSIPVHTIALSTTSPISQADLGRREPALAAIEEAVEIRRRLAAARPDSRLLGASGCVSLGDEHA